MRNTTQVRPEGGRLRPPLKQTPPRTGLVLFGTGIGIESAPHIHCPTPRIPGHHQPLSRPPHDFPDPASARWTECRCACIPQSRCFSGNIECMERSQRPQSTTYVRLPGPHHHRNLRLANQRSDPNRKPKQPASAKAVSFNARFSAAARRKTLLSLGQPVGYRMKVGFRIARQGKHIVMTNGTRIITIPRHNPVNAFTMGGIARDAGLTPDEFRDLQ